MPQYRHPTSGGGAPLFEIDSQRRVDDPQLNFSIHGSPHLSQWDPLPTMGLNTDELVLDPDPAEDGIFGLRRFRVRPGSPYQFFRFDARISP